jgi:hypothetical protein
MEILWDTRSTDGHKNLMLRDLYFDATPKMPLQLWIGDIPCLHVGMRLVARSYDEIQKSRRVVAGVMQSFVRKGIHPAMGGQQDDLPVTNATPKCA